MANMLTLLSTAQLSLMPSWPTSNDHFVWLRNCPEAHPCNADRFGEGPFVVSTCNGATVQVEFTRPKEVSGLFAFDVGKSFWMLAFVLLKVATHDFQKLLYLYRTCYYTFYRLHLEISAQCRGQEGGVWSLWSRWRWRSRTLTSTRWQHVATLVGPCIESISLSLGPLGQVNEAFASVPLAWMKALHLGCSQKTYPIIQAPVGREDGRKCIYWQQSKGAFPPGSNQDPSGGPPKTIQYFMACIVRSTALENEVSTGSTPLQRLHTTFETCVYKKTLYFNTISEIFGGSLSILFNILFHLSMFAIRIRKVS